MNLLCYVTEEEMETQRCWGTRRATKGWSHAFYFSWLWMASFQLQRFTKLTNFPKFTLYGIFRLFPLFITFCIFQNFYINFTKQLVHYSLISLIAVMAAIKLIVAATQNMYLDEQNTVFSSSALFPLFRKPERAAPPSVCKAAPDVKMFSAVMMCEQFLNICALPCGALGKRRLAIWKEAGKRLNGGKAKGVFSVSHTKLCS